MELELGGYFLGFGIHMIYVYIAHTVFELYIN